VPEKSDIACSIASPKRISNVWKTFYSELEIEVGTDSLIARAIEAFEAQEMPNER